MCERERAPPGLHVVDEAAEAGENHAQERRYQEHDQHYRLDPEIFLVNLLMTLGVA